jgi:hypothetical protein
VKSCANYSIMDFGGKIYSVMRQDPGSSQNAAHKANTGLGLGHTPRALAGL